MPRSRETAVQSGTARSETVRVSAQLNLRVLRWDGALPGFVLVHGLASNALLWRAGAEMLSQGDPRAGWGHAVTEIDLRGHGESDVPASGYDTATAAGDVAAVIATLGLSPEEAARHPVTAPPSDGDTRAVEISYRYAAEQADANGELIRGGLVVPLRSDGEEPIGTLAVFWRDGARQPSEDEVSSLEDLAANAGPAIENARRFREARNLADLDALTNLHNRRYFHDTLAREVARAQRYDRRLALVVFDIDDFKAINERVGHLSGDSVLAQLAERVRSVVRSADIACRVGGDEFAVILPESQLPDAEQLYRRLQFAVSTRPTGAADRLHLSAGIAELTPEDDAVSFFERADEALFRAKETGKDQAVAAQSGA